MGIGNKGIVMLVIFLLMLSTIESFTKFGSMQRIIPMQVSTLTTEDLSLFDAITDQVRRSLWYIAVFHT